jgi:DNA repair ATPase RecN
MTDEKCAWEINLTGKSKREKKKIELKVMEKIELKTMEKNRIEFKKLEIESKKIPHSQKCKKILKECYVKLATKSDTLQNCDDFVEECQKKMGRKFEDVKKMVLDKLSHTKNCLPGKGKELIKN